MKCTTCSNEIPAGAKFCVHCGSTVVATAAPPVAAKAAVAAAAATIATAARPVYVPPAPTTAVPSGMSPMGNTNAPGTLPPDPMLAPAPTSRLGLIAGVLAVVAVLGIGTFVAYKMFFAKDVTPVVTTDPAKSDAATAPSSDATKDSSATAGQGTGSGSNMSAPIGSPADVAAQAAAAAEAAKAAGPGTPPTPADAAAAKAAAAKSAAAAAARADANKAPPVGGAPSASPPMAAPAPAVQHVPAPAAAARAPTVDRWEQMRVAYTVCDREGFFDKIACNSRVGKQFCEGYWGKVPQCPVGAYGDRAN